MFAIFIQYGRKLRIALGISTENGNLLYESKVISVIALNIWELLNKIMVLHHVKAPEGDPTFF